MQFPGIGQFFSSVLLKSYKHSASAFLVRTDACLSVAMKKIIIAILE